MCWYTVHWSFRPFLQQLQHAVPSKTIPISKLVLLEHGNNWLQRYLLGILSRDVQRLGKKKKKGSLQCCQTNTSLLLYLWLFGSIWLSSKWKSRFIFKAGNISVHWNKLTRTISALVSGNTLTNGTRGADMTYCQALHTERILAGFTHALRSIQHSKQLVSICLWKCFSSQLSADMFFLSRFPSLGLKTNKHSASICLFHFL